MAGDNDERPKKSWREIDRARESGQRREGAERSSGMNDRSASYRNYKSQLNRLFDGGGGVPDALREKLGGEPASASEMKARRAAAKTIVDAVGPAAVKASLAAYRSAHGFPEDEEALGKILDLSDERLVLEALETIERLHGDGRLKRAAALRARVKTVIATMDDPDVLTKARALVGHL